MIDYVFDISTFILLIEMTSSFGLGTGSFLCLWIEYFLVILFTIWKFMIFLNRFKINVDTHSIHEWKWWQSMNFSKKYPSCPIPSYLWIISISFDVRCEVCFILLLDDLNIRIQGLCDHKLFTSVHSEWILTQKGLLKEFYQVSKTFFFEKTLWNTLSDRNFRTLVQYQWRLI